MKKHMVRRVLTMLLSIVMVLGIFPPVALADRWQPGVNPGLQPELLGLARQAAAESIVLLENDPVTGTPGNWGAGQPILPLPAGTNVALFGRHQINYFHVGYGSGGEVNMPPGQAVNILQAMRRHPGINVDEDVVAYYQAWAQAFPPRSAGWAAWPLSHPEMPISDLSVAVTEWQRIAGLPVAERAAARTDALGLIANPELGGRTIVETAAANNDVAVVIIGRSAGEDRDNLLNRRPLGVNDPVLGWSGTGAVQLNEGSWYLTDREVTMLEEVTNAFDNVIVLLNAGNIFDMSWLGLPAGFVHDCGNPDDRMTGLGGIAGMPASNLHEFCLPGNCVYLRYDNIDTDAIKAVSYVWQGGVDAGFAVVDVLTGELSPSGRLHTTIANTIDDFPAVRQSGYANFMQYGEYWEDVFVGYRYFETFNHSAVRYPFGFGLSYTTFDIDVQNHRVVSVPGSNVPGQFGWGPSDQIELTIRVTNTGSHAAKEVVQVYHSSPNVTPGFTKPARELIAYAKTNTLLPGASETLVITFDVNDMSAFADFNIGTAENPIAHAWVLEAGNYGIFVGNSVADTRGPANAGNDTWVFNYNVPATRITNQLSEALAVPASMQFDRMVVDLTAGPAADGSPHQWTTIPTPVSTLNNNQVINDTVRGIRPSRGFLEGDAPSPLRQRILDDLAATDTWAPNLPYNTGTPLTGTHAPIQLVDVFNGDYTLEQFMAQMTVEELAELTKGNSTAANMMDQPDGTGSAQVGIAGLFGGNNPRMRNFFGIPSVAAADGPSGLRMTPQATLMPMATALAATWNDPLVQELYSALGREMLRNGVDMLLAPGMDLQRTPLNGRNFEYFSEDALLNGNMGANAVRGLHRVGVAASPKHFTANNQEANRYNHDARVTARALNELYIRGYENIINTTNLQATMGSYALINGRFSHMNYELNHIVMREHLGFEGLIMTDWWLRTDYAGARGRGGDHVSRAYSREFDLGPGAIPISVAPDGEGGFIATIDAPAVNTDTTVNPGGPRRSLDDILTLPLDGRWLGQASGTGNPVAFGAPGSTGAQGEVNHPDSLGSNLNNHDLTDGMRFGYNSYRIRGRLDLLMPGNQWRGRGAAWAYNGDGSGSPNGVNWSMSNPIHMYRLGFLNIGEIQAAGRNVLHVAMQSARFRLDNDLPLADFGPMEPIFSVAQTQVAPPVLDGITLTTGGQTVPLANFVSNVTNYVVFARDLENLPVVEGIAREGLVVTVTPSTESGGFYTTTTITVTDPAIGLSRYYRVHFNSTTGAPSQLPGGEARLVEVRLNDEVRLDFHPMRWQQAWSMRVPDGQDIETAAVTATAAPGSEIVAIVRTGNQVQITVESDFQRVIYTINLVTTGDDFEQPPVTPIVADGPTRFSASLARNWNFGGAGGATANNPDSEGMGGGTDPNIHQHMLMTTNRFTTYNIDVEEAGYYHIRLRYAANITDSIATHLLIPVFVGLEETDPATTVTYGATGGAGGAAEHWQTSADFVLWLDEGFTWLRVFARDLPFSLNWIELERFINDVALYNLVHVEIPSMDLDEADFTAGSWAALQTALTDANAALDAQAPTQTQINNAYDALRAALGALVDISELRALVAYAEELDEADFTTDSWADFAKALADAQNVLDNPAATAEEIEHALDALQTAMDALIPALPPTGIEITVDVEDGNITVTVDGNYDLSAEDGNLVITLPDVDSEYTIRLNLPEGWTYEQGVDENSNVIIIITPPEGSEIIEYPVGSGEFIVRSVRETHIAYMHGNPAGQFLPLANINRAEVAAILVRTMVPEFVEGTLPGDMERFDTFPDVGVTNWFYYYVAWAYDAELVQGDDRGNFLPRDPISRQELAAMLSRTLDESPNVVGEMSFYDVADISNWARLYVYAAYAEGLMIGDTQNNFRPRASINRAEVATAVNRMLGRLDSREALAAATMENLDDARTFPDVAAHNWFFASVLGAANDHQLTRDGEGNISWKDILPAPQPES
ncbi:MAG: S-layer homology domain-containing protein [Oscillospiraceae bacterium]|nr:S-layer homology domain-containing protein [Oscillospiraceae bacterium]